MQNLWAKMSSKALLTLVVLLAIAGLVYYYSPRCTAGDCQNGCGVREQRQVFHYKGCFRKGRAHGKGTFRAVVGLQYEGHWQDGQKAGYGEQTYPDGSRYAGHWLDGKRHGNGTLYDAAGQQIYSGQWLEDQQRPH